MSISSISKSTKVALSEDREHAILARLGAIDIPIEEGQKRIKKFFSDAVINCYFMKLLEEIVDRAGSLENLGHALEVHRTTIGRWTDENNPTPPLLDNVLMGAVAFDVPFGSVLGRGQALAFESLRTVVTLVRREILSETCERMDVIDQICITASVLPEWLDGVRSGNHRDAEELIRVAGKKLFQIKLSVAFPDAQKRYLAWSEAWEISQLLMPYEWDYERSAAS